MPPYAVGVDVGKSGTTAVVLDPPGEILGRGQSGFSDYRSVDLTAISDASLCVMWCRPNDLAAGPTDGVMGITARSASAVT